MLVKLKDQLPPADLGDLLDVASTHRRVAELLGRPVKTMDIAEGADFIWDVGKFPMPSLDQAFQVVTCFNYLLLTENPSNVIANICRFLKQGGVAILSFSSLTYWYRSNDGIHRQSYNPDSIEFLLKPYFQEIELYPVGNFLQATMNYYAKKSPRWLSIFLRNLAYFVGFWDKDPKSAIEYIAVVRKA